jgi:hypothetical protein
MLWASVRLDATKRSQRGGLAAGRNRTSSMISLSQRVARIPDHHRSGGLNAWSSRRAREGFEHLVTA